MCRKTQTTFNPTAAATAAGRELIDSALQRNPVAAMAAAIVVPILSLFCRRRAPSAASVEKMKLESYSYRPVASTTGPATPLGKEGARRLVEGIQKGSATLSGRSRRATTGVGKGGNRHG